jgi:heme ABC exporter ATP-binding subunit CcmA
MSEAALAVNGVWKYFGDFPALRKVTLRVDQGSCVALLGRNGAGKTTLLKILSGLAAPSEGTILLEGKSPRDAATRARIGLIGHGIAVYDELTALENLEIFAQLYGMSNPAATAREWLKRVNLAHVENGKAREFSRGMRQRLAVARAFLHAPKLLILDEPFTGLDDRSISLLQGLLRDALAQGATAILSTHQLPEAMELATHVALLNRGQLAFAGERTPDMLADPNWVYKHYGDAAG